MSTKESNLMLSEFIGQDSVKERCLALMQKPSYSILLRGFWGMGKTTLAIALAWRNGFFTVRTAPLSSVNFRNDVIHVIDEAHRLDFEPLYEKMKGRKLIFCSNMASEVPEPFLSRTHEFRLQNYTVTELTKIVEVHSVKFEGELARVIAKRSRGNPRIAVMLADKLESLIRWGSRDVTEDTLVGLFEDKLEIDERGLHELDRQYLEALKDGPKSKSTLQSLLQVDAKHLNRMERFLLRENLIEITSKGRSLV